MRFVLRRSVAGWNACLALVCGSTVVWWVTSQMWGKAAPLVILVVLLIILLGIPYAGKVELSLIRSIDCIGWRNPEPVYRPHHHKFGQMTFLLIFLRGTRDGPKTRIGIIMYYRCIPLRMNLAVWIANGKLFTVTVDLSMFWVKSILCVGRVPRQHLWLP